MKIARKFKHKIRVKFEYDEELIAQIRTLVGRRFSEKKKVWIVEDSINNIELLQKWGFTLDKELRDRLEENIKENERRLDFSKLKSPIRDFQEKGVAFVQKKNGRALIADQMGLGKTAQALVWLELNPDALPALVITPNSVKLNWRKECRLWMNKPRVKTLWGREPETINKPSIVIINYDIMDAWKDEIDKTGFRTIIIDEPQNIKGNNALRTKAVQQVTKNIKFVIALSGTPIVNRPIEFFNILNIIAPNRFPSRWNYAWRYCSPKNTYSNKFDFSGASNTEELHKIVTENVMIRRQKSDVMKELPEKVRTVIPMQLTNRREYIKAEADFIRWLSQFDEEKARRAKNAEAIVRIEGLKQLAVKGKIDQCVEWIQDFLDTDEKLVVFCTHKFVVNQLMDKFKDIAVKIDGSVNVYEKQSAVDKFQTDDKTRLLVGNIKAAGTGITLTKASSTCTIELGWTPGEHDQAEDRVHRIGQEADSVNAYYLLTKDTIEEQIAQLIEKKRKVLAQVLDGKKTSGEQSIFNELIGSF